MNIKTFLAKHPVFTRAEFDEALSTDYSTGRNVSNARLAHHVRAGHVVQIRRGLYASVPAGTEPSSFVPDPWLAAAKMADDAVIAYHSAFQFHGRAYSMSNRYLFLSTHALRPKEVRGCRYRCVPYPKKLKGSAEQQFAVETTDRLGLNVRVTALERALVDVLDRPDLGGGWEEIWRSAEGVEYYDIKQVVDYALLLRNATTAAKVGFFLEQHQEQLMVETGQLARLRGMRPRQPHYLEHGKAGRLVATWNLIVPDSIMQQAWEED